MAIACPVDLDTLKLRAEIQSIYARVAADPAGEFHFHRGPDYAVERLGYDGAELAKLPRSVTASFAGIGNPHAIAPLARGATVVDIGCGAGTDLLLAALHVGSEGRAIGVDMTEAMREQARRGAATCGLRHVEVRDGEATALPVDSESVDVVISNGVLNLVPEKRIALGEIRRILKPGGRVQIADIVLGVELSEDARHDIDLWAGWIAGALLEAELVAAFEEAGFADARITQRFNCFEGTSKEKTAMRYGVMGVNVSAVRSSGRMLA